MAIKVEWDKSNQEFYVKLDSSGRRKVFKRSADMTSYLRSITSSNWTFSRAAKKQVEKGK